MLGEPAATSGEKGENVRRQTGFGRTGVAGSEVDKLGPNITHDVRRQASARRSSLHASHRTRLPTPAQPQHPFFPSRHPPRPRHTLLY